MQRMTAPAGHNQTTRCYKRTMNDAFLCDARQAQAFHYFPEKKKRPGRWLATIIVGLVLVSLFGCAKPQPTPVSQERAIPKGACEKGEAGIWIDATTIQCFKEMK